MGETDPVVKYNNGTQYVGRKYDPIVICESDVKKDSFIHSRVWDCRNWECERWTVLSGRVQTACWANSGTTLIFATTTETIIYAVIVKSDVIFTSDTEGSATQAVPLIDVSKVDIDGVIVGGLIQCMESDPKGKHVAVLFQETDCVAIFRIIRQPGLQLIARYVLQNVIMKIQKLMFFSEKNCFPMKLIQFITQLTTVSILTSNYWLASIHEGLKTKDLLFYAKITCTTKMSEILNFVLSIKNAPIQSNE